MKPKLLFSCLVRFAFRRHVYCQIAKEIHLIHELKHRRNEHNDATEHITLSFLLLVVHFLYVLMD